MHSVFPSRPTEDAALRNIEKLAAIRANKTLRALGITDDEPPPFAMYIAPGKPLNERRQRHKDALCRKFNKGKLSLGFKKNRVMPSANPQEIADYINTYDETIRFYVTHVMIEEAQCGC